MSEKYQRTQIRSVFSLPPPLPLSLFLSLSPSLPLLLPLSLSYYQEDLTRHEICRDGSTAAATSKMERLVVILDVAAAVDSYLI